MPIYEYTCESCGHSFEKLMKNSSAAPGPCPQCGTDDLRKLFSSFSATVAAGASDGCPAASQCPSGSRCSRAGCPL